MNMLGLCTALFLGSGQTGVETAYDANSYMEFRLETGVRKQSVELITDLSQWEPANQKLQETSPGVYTLKIRRPWFQRVHYKFLINGQQWVDDPSNPQKVPDGHGGANSFKETGFKDSPLFAALPLNKIWNVTTLHVNSPNGPRNVFILTPPFATEKPTATIYLNDGSDYLSQSDLPLALANYYERGGEPFTAVLISNTKERFAEYGSVEKNAYDRWVAETVVPEVEARWNVSRNANDRIVMGSSMGGLAALRTGFTSNLFGNVVTQSGSFFYPETQTQRFENILDNRENTPRIWSSFGTYEGFGIKDSNRALPNQFSNRNIPSTMIETPTTHDWTAWKNQLTDILPWISQRNKKTK